jgi:hypothetical protein
VNLSEGQVVSLLVGQQPTPLTANVEDNVTVGGGGGTFVTSGGKPLIVASGGDGGVYSTGYLRSELVTPNYQIKVSMSADGNIYAAIEVNFITFQFALTIYRYSVGVWTPELTAPAGFTGVALSGNGKTVAVPTSNYITVYEYVDQIWQNPRYITNIDWNSVSTTIQISYDGNTIVAFTEDIAFNWHLYVCTKNQDLTWNTEELSAPANDIFSVYESYSCAISGDGTRIFAAADTIGSFPTVSNVWSYSRTNDTWSLPEIYTSPGTVRVESTSASYDGQIVAIYAGNLYTEPREGYLYVYENGTLTKNLTFPWVVQQYPAGAAQISYDGSLVLVTLITGKILVTPSTQITIFDDASGFPLPSGSMDSTASRIVSPYYDAVNPITYFFEAGGSGQPGAFLPSGAGSGISGAGYLTDGQETNPFFGFLKPTAYVDGGFGNTYLYGHKGEGGFGGGQSPLNNQTDLTSVTGYKQVRPTISLVSPGLNGMAISEDANTLLVSFVTGSGTKYANVYTYDGTSWVSTNLYTTSVYGHSVAMSGDGSVWLINADVWRNGSFETQLQSFTPVGIGFDYTDISRDGNTIAIIYGQTGGTEPFDKTVRLIVYSYSGSWTSSTLFSENPGTEFSGYVCAMSADGNTIAMSYSVAAYSFVNVYRRVDDTWSGPEQILYETHDSMNNIVLNVNSDGSIITLASDGGYYSQYSNGVLSKVDFNTRSVAFSQTDPKLYAWVDATTVFVPSISLEVNVHVDPAGIDVLRMGTNVLAMTKILTPHAIVFLDMYDPTTTCTANTSVPHGYPHDYKVQITGTQYFNGTWDIVTSTANTFTFQAFGGPSVSSGYVSGTTTGVSGAGGYTGSPGDGVSGATCYADPAVTNFTDLGATSNSAGYVTVSLVDPPPITLVYDDTIVGSEIYVSPSGFAYWSDIAYSPELKIFVAPSSFYNGQGIAYSTDGKQWFRSDYEGAGASALSWSPELGIFITGTNYRIYTSSNGKNWTLASSIDFVGFADVIWVQFLHEFICITTIDNYSSFYKSSDGINWYPITVSPPVYYGDYGHSIFAASPDTVIACLSTYVYASTDGVNWDTALTTSGNIKTVSYGNGIFLVVTDAFYYYYSTDKGQTWSNGILPYTNIGAYISSVFTDSLAIVTGDRETFISADCVSWERYPNNTMLFEPGASGYNSAVYNPLDKYIVAVSNREINLTVDGSIWVPADTTFIGAAYDNVAYSPETNTVVAVASNGQISTETGVYTKDGVNWKRIPGLYFNPTSCRWNPLQNLFFLNNYAFDPVSGTLSHQDSYREWIEPTTPPQLLQSYYQQGLNNNLPIGKAFSLTGIIVDTGATVFGGDRVSCSGDVFIKMGRNPGGTAYRSTDGTNWESYQLQGNSMVECNRIVYVSKYKAFFSLSGQEGRVYKSYDSVNWSTVYQSPGIYLYDMLWCSTMNKLLLFSSANNLTELTFSN